MRSSILVAILFVGLGAIVAPAAFAELYQDVESARANARAGGPVSEHDRDLIRRYGALSGTRGYSKSGLYRLDEHHHYAKRKHRRHHD